MPSGLIIFGSVVYSIYGSLVNIAQEWSVLSYQDLS